jgi:hypothetical protein
MTPPLPDRSACAHTRCNTSDRCTPARRSRARPARLRQTGVRSSPAPVVGVHAPSGAPTALRGSRPGRPAARSDPRPEPTHDTEAGMQAVNQARPTDCDNEGGPARLVGLGRSPVRDSGRVAGGIAAPGSHGSGRDSLPSPSSSDQPSGRADPPPVGEQAGLSFEQPGPPPLEPLVGPQPFVLLPCPAPQVDADAPQEGV